MSVFNLGAIEVFAAIGLIAPRLGGHAMHSDLTKVSLLIARFHFLLGGALTCTATSDGGKLLSAVLI